jgi:hypothetical protein
MPSVTGSISVAAPADVAWAMMLFRDTFLPAGLAAAKAKLEG